jgi:hypothetical protein
MLLPDGALTLEKLQIDNPEKGRNEDSKKGRRVN